MLDAYKLSKYFAKPYLQKYWTEIHDVTAIWKRNVCSIFNARLALRTDFLGLRVKVSRTLSTFSSVTLALTASPFLEDRCILYNEIVHTTFGTTSQENHDVQIAIGTCVEPPPQIPGHTNYARSVRKPFTSSNGLRFSREMAEATIGPFQMLRSLYVINTNFTILQHFLLKLWLNEILR
jgi:hypothetical protein